MRISYLPTAAFWCACSMAPPYLKAAIPLTCDRFPPTVQLWPWTPGHPMVPGRSPVEYCFPGRHTQPIRQKDHAAAPKHPTIGCLFWGRKGRVPFLGKGAMWAGGQIFQGFCNRIILCDVPLNGRDRLQISVALGKVKNSFFHWRNIYLLYIAIKDWAFLHSAQNTLTYDYFRKCLISVTLCKKSA